MARIANPSVDSKVLVPLSSLRPSTTFAGTRFVLVDMWTCRQNVLVGNRLWAVTTVLSDIGHADTTEVSMRL